MTDYLNSIPYEILQRIWHEIQDDVNHVDSPYGEFPPALKELGDHSHRRGELPEQQKCRLEREKRWRAWKLYWLIPRLRPVIDEHYRRWLRRGRVWLRMEVWWLFNLATFTGGTPRSELAIFQGCRAVHNSRWGMIEEEDEDPENARITSDLIRSTLTAPSEPGYRPLVYLQIGDGLTDMLPMDFTYSFDEGQTCCGQHRLSFNWRQYLATLYFEHHRTSTSQIRDYEKHEICDYNLVERASTLHTEWSRANPPMRPKVNFGGLVMRHLLQSTNSPQYGVDGRSYWLRRERRLHLAKKTGMLSEECTALRHYKLEGKRRGSSPDNLAERRHSQLDEELVAKILLSITSMIHASENDSKVKW